MNSHAMRLPTEDRSVVMQLKTPSRDGVNFYRIVPDDNPFSDQEIINGGLVGHSTAPVSHHDDRVADMVRPIVRVSPFGRTYRIGYNLDGQFRVEIISA